MCYPLALDAVVLKKRALARQQGSNFGAVIKWWPMARSQTMICWPSP